MARITRRVVVTSALVAVAFAALAFAGETPDWFGAAKSHRSIERFDMSVGVTAGQTARRPVQFEEVREVYAVPSHYGTLVSVTGDTKRAVLWYSDGSGNLRNVTLEDPADTMYEIRQSGTLRLEVDARER